MSAQPDNPQFSTLNSRLLKQYWGYDRFRGIQEDIINSISENKDTLGLMPTGGGKSITFQVPALAKDGLCLVITPDSPDERPSAEFKEAGHQSACHLLRHEPAGHYHNPRELHLRRL